jgi:hypothetical protein
MSATARLRLVTVATNGFIIVDLGGEHQQSSKDGKQDEAGGLGA